MWLLLTLGYRLFIKDINKTDYMAATNKTMQDIFSGRPQGSPLQAAQQVFNQFVMTPKQLGLLRKALPRNDL